MFIFNKIVLKCQVPLLDNGFVQGTLVRFKGMIQDMLNPEYYSKIVPHINSQHNGTLNQVRKIVLKNIVCVYPKCDLIFSLKMKCRQMIL